MFQLKSYQERAVECLEVFLSNCQSLQSVEEAYKYTLKEQHLPELVYKDYGFGQVPYVCLRIPTGGGKTVLGSYAIDIAARNYIDTDAPITLWLVPTNTIRLQTVDALKTVGHPYRDKLDRAFNHQVLVFDIDEVTQIRPHDIGNKAIVIVSTLANLRVSDTSGRKVYAYHENFEPHFSKIPANHSSILSLERVTEADVQENGLSAKDIGKVKYSFANLLAIHRPVLIVDEAHNARTSLTFDTLRRVHPAVVVELTATPNTSHSNGSNILFHVSASELKSEHMIKLPIVLTEHQNWQDALRDAVITRNKLELDAQKDIDYIRPIALFQAEPKNGEITVEVLKSHLLEELHIDENKIAIATGNQRDLDGINLFDPLCEIEYIITIEALKEGWDCSFAYVFCSVKQVSSSKDAEQLLGRVLRMPYAKRRVIEDLNRAYAHLSTSKFSRAAQELTDKLIAMGFEEMEVSAFLREKAPTHGEQGDLFGENEKLVTQIVPKPAIVVEVREMPDVSGLSPSERSQMSMTRKDEAAVVRVEGQITPAIQKVLESQSLKPKDKAKLQRDIRIHNQRIDAQKAPSERGSIFGALPLVCMTAQGELELVESEIFLHTSSWDLLSYPAELPGFSLQETTNSFSIDIEGNKLSYHVANEGDTLSFNDGFIDLTENDLVRWLDKKLRQQDINQSQLTRFLARLVNWLLRNSSFSLVALNRNKLPLSRAIDELIRLYRKRAQKEGYQSSLFGNENSVCLSEQFVYEFFPDSYPSRQPYYSGRYKFQKHFFPQNLIEDLKANGEEYDCAIAIDGMPEIRYWIRNLVRRDKASFWLPLAHRKFYPDFVCELEDGRMLVIEYKGDAYVTNDDSAEKRAIGNKWADMSEGKCMFLMAVKKDSNGRDIRQQVLNLIS